MEHSVCLKIAYTFFERCHFKKKLFFLPWDDDARCCLEKSLAKSLKSRENVASKVQGRDVLPYMPMACGPFNLKWRKKKLEGKPKNVLNLECDAPKISCTIQRYLIVVTKKVLTCIHITTWIFSLFLHKRVVIVV